MSRAWVWPRGDARMRKRWNAVPKQRLRRLREHRDKKDKRKGMETIEDQKAGAALQREKTDPTV